MTVTTPRVTVVGLGPGGEHHVTAQTLAEIARVPHRFVRTTIHPTSHLVGDGHSFDDVYEVADTFDDVYAEITDRLVAAAHEHGEVLYAVPGSPLVLERTVRRLRTADGISCTVHPAMSFLDVAYARLGIDPVEAGVRLVDGHDFAVSAAGERGPLLVAHCHADWVLSDIKLAVDDATGDEDVVILQRLGTPDELVTKTTWAELDRTVAADHLTSIYIPRGCLHGFQALTEADTCYRIDAPHDPAEDVTVRYDDPDLAIDWPLPVSVMSEKDEAGGSWADLTRRLGATAGR